MMSQPFNINRPGPNPRQDLMMMNNNYLPGVSRLNGTAQFPFVGDMMANTQPLLPGFSNGQHQFATRPATVQNFVIDTERISTNFSGCSSGNLPDMADIELNPNSSIQGSILSPVETISAEMNSPSLCENQGSIAQNPNISQNPGWSAVYNPGSLSQCSTSNFTFTTPTQSYLHSPALTATSQSRFQYARMRPQTFAPGCSSPWQHCAPKRMASVRQRSFSSPQPLSIYTGSQSSSVSSTSVSFPESTMATTSTYYSYQMNEPVASCSEVMRRPKRRHTIDTTDDNGPENKVYLTDEKIARHMKELSIHNLSCQPQISIPKGCQPQISIPKGATFVDTGQDLVPMADTLEPHITQAGGCGTEMLKHSERQWHDFKLLEERLEMIDEDSSENEEEVVKSEPVLCLAEGIEIKPQSVIPQEILDKIRNPCQEIVLWSPPDASVKKMIGPDEEIADNPSNVTGDMMEDLVSVDTQSEVETGSEDSGMETEPLGDLVEL